MVKKEPLATLYEREPSNSTINNISTSVGSAVSDLLSSIKNGNNSATQSNKAELVNLSDVLKTYNQNLANKAQGAATVQNPTSGKSTGGSSSNAAVSSAVTGTPYNYTTSDNLAAVEAILRELEGNKPGEYQSQYQAELDALYDKIVNRGDFAYDANEDPLYSTYKDKYTKGGQLAMQDTMANAAALTGGYGNTYAQMAGQQAYNEYMTALADILPQLEAQAYSKWQDAGQELYNQFNLLQGRDQDAYNRYRDTVGDYYSDLAYQYGKYQDTYANEYERYMDALSQSNYLNELAMSASKSSGGSSKSSSSKNLDEIAYTLYDKYGASGMSDTALSSYGLSGDAKSYVKNIISNITGSYANDSKKTSSLQGSKGTNTSATKKDTSTGALKKLLGK